MNLNDISDEELDQLFKASAENFDLAFDPEAWRAMDQKLGEVMVQDRWFRKYLTLLALLVFFGVPAVYFVKDAPNDKEASEKIISTKEKEAKSDYSIQRDSVKDSYPLPSEPSSKTNTDAADTILKINVSKTVSHNHIKNRSTQKKVSFVKSEASALHRTSVQPPLISEPSRNSLTKEQPESSTSRATPLAAKPGDTTDLLLPERNGEKGEFTPNDTIISASSLTNKGQEEVPQDTLGEKDEQERLPKTSSFLRSVQISLAVAPDVTTVKFKDAEAVSVNAGILLGIPVTSRVSLVTGIVWANKEYYAKPEEYQFSNGYTYTSPIEATCSVLDIPVNVRYKVLERGRNMFAVQAGLSSYVMLKEKYSSGYSKYGGSYAYTYEVDNDNRHWFQVQNVSLVFTRAISPVFSVGVEPFVKIPYTGIGAGKVNLTSAGVFFSAGYTIKLRP